MLKENGIPFGFGTMYDDEGLLVHKGIVIDWKRFGYGVRYRDNASVEYEGYWCDDKRCGRGKLYDRSGQLIKECEWWNGSDCGTEYIGDGSQPVYIGIKHLKLEDRSVLSDWNVSWFYNLESIEIGDNCFNDVAIFEIKEMPQLRSLKIGSYSFGGNQKNHSNGKIKSFCIMDCESLELIEIGDNSFHSFEGRFKLQNLKSLKTIRIGSIYKDSFNVYRCSCVIRGIANNEHIII